MGNKEFIYEYWSRTKLGKEMIKSNNISESDLLFLIPNNVKKMHGLPITRMSKKQKRKQKNQRKRNVMSFKLFDIVEEIIDEKLGSRFSNDKFFDGFVEFKKFNYGDKDEYNVTKYKNLGYTPNLYKGVKIL